ncbi:hypothetical protein G6F24_018270 [Rhizopus arrhizus]|nr:hypothetical protein G6F24_018270 [Rhizopus arrhizus]
MELLQALFDNGWKSGGLEPTGMWLALATLQAETGRSDDVPATLARIKGPAEIIRLRSDKRFDRYVDRSDPHFDPVQAAQKHLDELRQHAADAGPQRGRAGADRRHGPCGRRR